MTEHCSPATLAAFAEWVATGLGFSDLANKHNELNKALRHAAAEAHVPSVQAFADQLLAARPGDPAALHRVVHHLTIGESYFFRDAPLFQALEAAVLPQLLADRAGQPLRIWSAACSTGEEPYSVALTLDRLQSRLPHQIVGTDVNPRAIAAARAHTWRPWSLRTVEPHDRERWFRQVRGELWQLRPSLAQHVAFAEHNLLDAGLPAPICDAPMDVILCRNVLIYMDTSAAERIVQRLLDHVVDDGWLIVAAVESFLVPTPPAEMVDLGGALAFRVRAHQRGTGLPWPNQWLQVCDLPTHVSHPAPVAAAESAWTQLPSGGFGATADAAIALTPPPLARVTPPPLPALPPVSADLDVATLYRRGLAAEEVGADEEAATLWRQALYLQDHHLMTQLALTRQQLRLGQLRRAERSLRVLQAAVAHLDPAAPVPEGDGRTMADVATAVRELQAQMARASGGHHG